MSDRSSQATCHQSARREMSYSSGPENEGHYPLFPLETPPASCGERGLQAGGRGQCSTPSPRPWPRGPQALCHEPPPTSPDPCTLPSATVPPTLAWTAAALPASARLRHRHRHRCCCPGKTALPPPATQPAPLCPPGEMPPAQAGLPKRGLPCTVRAAPRDIRKSM